MPGDSVSLSFLQNSFYCKCVTVWTVEDHTRNVSHGFMTYCSKLNRLKLYGLVVTLQNLRRKRLILLVFSHFFMSCISRLLQVYIHLYLPNKCLKTIKHYLGITYFSQSALSNFLTAYCNNQVSHISPLFHCCSLLEEICILYHETYNSSS